MKILHLNNEKTWRGGERQTLLLAAALPRLGVTGSIGCRPGGPLMERAKAQNIPTICISGNSIQAAFALARAAKHFDLIHCHTGRGHSLASALAFAHGKPIIVTRRVDFLPKQSWFNRRKYNRAAKVVCISGFIARQLEDWGIPKDKLAIVRSAVPIPVSGGTSSPRVAELRAKLGIPPGIRLVGNIAALAPHKDHVTLLRAAKIVTTQRQDVAFVIVGEGELKENLLRLRSELGLDGVVHFTGFIPKAEELLGAFDVFAMSSCMEGLGSIVLDAFAAGVPVASTAGGGLPELVRNAETGLLVPVGDAAALAAATMRLLDEKDLRAQLSTAARKWVQNECSVENMAARYAEIYRSVLGR